MIVRTPGKGATIGLLEGQCPPVLLFIGVVSPGGWLLRRDDDVFCGRRGVISARPGCEKSNGVVASRPLGRRRRHRRRPCKLFFGVVQTSDFNSWAVIRSIVVWRGCAVYAEIHAESIPALCVSSRGCTNPSLLRIHFGVEPTLVSRMTPMISPPCCWCQTNAWVEAKLRRCGVISRAALGVQYDLCAEDCFVDRGVRQIDHGQTPGGPDACASQQRNAVSHEPVGTTCSFFVTDACCCAACRYFVRVKSRGRRRSGCMSPSGQLELRDTLSM